MTDQTPTTSQDPHAAFHRGDMSGTQLLQLDPNLRRNPAREWSVEEMEQAVLLTTVKKR